MVYVPHLAANSEPANDPSFNKHPCMPVPPAAVYVWHLAVDSKPANDPCFNELSVHVSAKGCLQR